MTKLNCSLFASLTLGIMATGTAFADDDVDVDAEVTVEGEAKVVVPAPPPVVVTAPNVYVETMTESTVVPVRQETTMTTTTRYGRRPSLMSGIGVAVTAGAGGSGFTNNTLRDTTEAGANWDARVTIGTMLPIAFEASYIGSAQNLNTLGLNNDALLVGNGAQGALRVNVLPGRRLSPFVFGGAAWRHYQLANVDGANTSDVATDDDVLEIPVGAGLGLTTGNFLLDLRGEYRAAFRENLVPSAGGDNGANAPMNRWGATLSGGVAF